MNQHLQKRLNVLLDPFPEATPKRPLKASTAIEPTHYLIKEYLTLLLYCEVLWFQFNPLNSAKSRFQFEPHKLWKTIFTELNG